MSQLAQAAPPEQRLDAGIGCEGGRLPVPLELGLVAAVASVAGVAPMLAIWQFDRTE